MIKRRRLGQHTLVDRRVQEAILEAARVSKSEVVYEIGTGKGEFTHKLCDLAARVVSSEIDPDLHREAARKLEGVANLTLVRGDGFSIDVKFDVLVSNLPYGESSRFIKWILFQRFNRAVVLVQKEFADKLLAPPRTRAYRSVSALAQYAFDIIPVFDVKPEAFRPPPKVSSQLIVLKPKRDRSIDKETVKKLTLLFSYRGRKVSSALRHIWATAKIPVDLSFLHPMFLDKRVEELTPDELVNLARDHFPR